MYVCLYVECTHLLNCVSLYICLYMQVIVICMIPFIFVHEIVVLKIVIYNLFGKTSGELEHIILAIH